MSEEIRSAALAKVNKSLAGLPYQTNKPPALSREGLCQLEIADGFPTVLELSPDGEKLATYTMILELPNDLESRHFIYEQILRLNVFQPFFSGGSLAIDPQGACVLHSHCVNTDKLSTQILNEHFSRVNENVTAIREKFDLVPEEGEEL